MSLVEMNLTDSQRRNFHPLESKIQARVREELSEVSSGDGKEVSLESDRVIPLIRRPRRVPAWVLSAAAVLILALGSNYVWNQRAQDDVQDPIEVASQDPLPEAWLWDDGVVAGAPVFDGLSDDDLEALLKEFEG